MTQASERSATLSEMVAEEIRALMARRRVSARSLAKQLGVSPSWVSYRLTGKQPIDINDLAQIARALEVGVHDLLPSPAAAAAAQVIEWYPRQAESAPRHTRRPRDNRPAGHPSPSAVRRSALLPRPRGGRAA